MRTGYLSSVNVSGIPFAKCQGTVSLVVNNRAMVFGRVAAVAALLFLCSVRTYLVVVTII
jgi:hypothetical protein